MRHFINVYDIKQILQDTHGYNKISQVNIHPEKSIIVVDHLSFPKIMQFDYSNKSQETLLKEINLEIATQTLIGDNYDVSS